MLADGFRLGDHQQIVSTEGCKWLDIKVDLGYQNDFK